MYEMYYMVILIDHLHGLDENVADIYALNLILSMIIFCKGFSISKKEEKKNTLHCEYLQNHVYQQYY